MKIRRLSIVLVMLFFVSTSLPMSYAEAGVSESTSDGSIGVSAWNNIITEELAVRLEKATDDEKIPVTVRIKDNVDFTQVDILARERAGVTEAQLESDVAQAQTQAEIEGKGENQKEIRAVYSKIKKERTKILSEYYQELNAKFLAEEGLDGAKCASVSRLLPWISGIELTKAQIYRLATGGRVTYIDVYDDNIGEDLATISDTRSIIGGQEAITVGYTGSGVRVGLVESGNPILADMGADSANITKTVPGTDTVHATMTSGIIKKMAPGCSIYSRPTSSVANVVDCCEELIEYHSVDVINISYGAAEGGVYNSVSRQMDELVKFIRLQSLWRRAIVVRVGM